MTRQKILDDFLENILKESIEIFNESHLKTPLKQTQDKSYEFKNDYLTKKRLVKKMILENFFQEKDLNQKLKKLKTFSLL